MRRGLATRTVLAAALFVLVIGGLLIALVVAIGRQRDSAMDARASWRAIATANRAEKLVLDVQGSVRGYLLSGSEQLLGPWGAARRELPAITMELTRVVGGDRAQQIRAQAIRVDAVSYLREYADRVIARARADGSRAGRELAGELQGTRRGDDLRRQFAAFVAEEERVSAGRSAEADADADRATAIAAGGLVLCILLLAAYALYLVRAVVVPVRDVAGAAERVAQGDLHVEVPARGRHEAGQLAQAFNAMARSLQQSRDELESQNAELEMQAIELEDRQTELAEAGDELRAQRDELERAAAHLAEEKRHAELFGSFGDRLAGESDVGALARIAVEVLAEAAGAQVGVLYAPRREEDGSWWRQAVLGLAEDDLPESVPAGGDGLAARAVSEGRVVSTPHGRTGLRVRALGGEAEVRHELHLPLHYGERPVGVVTLGSLEVDGFHGESPILERFGGQASVALAEALALAEVRWLAEVNRVVVDSVREGIGLTGPDGAVLLSNAALERLSTEILGVSVRAAAHLGPEDIAQRMVDPEGWLAAERRIAADPDEPTLDEFELAAGGQVFERYTVPVNGVDGARIGRLAMIRDVTAERHAERMKSDLMSTVSHELRTPLASVLGYTELLRARAMDAAARERILAVVHREAQRLSALIDDFLDLERIEQDRLRIRRAPFRVDEVLDEQVRIFSGQSEAHRLELDAGGSLVARGDRDRIAQVVANLLSNAIKYSPQGGPVRVEAQPRNGEVVVAVSDEGLGIPADEQEKVFEKFFRAQRAEVREIGGTGLGLALAHEIVAAHEGEMGFESVEGQGSRFWFTLPVG